MARASRREKIEKEERRRRFLLLFIGGLIAISGASVLDSMRTQGTTKRAAQRGERARPPTTIDSQVSKHKAKTGDRMNRDRIGAQYENMRAAPLSGYSTSGSDPDQVLDGVPLSAEQHPYSFRPDESVPLPTSDLDASVSNSLQEERDLEEWEKREREEYIREFVANARRMGYKVKVQSNYDVDYAPLGEAERQPAAPPVRSRDGATR